MNFPGTSSVPDILNRFPDQHALSTRITTNEISPPDQHALSTTGITISGPTSSVQHVLPSGKKTLNFNKIQTADAQLPSTPTETKENVLTIQLIRGNSYDPTMTAHDNLVAELKANNGHLPSMQGKSLALEDFTFHCPPELENIPLFFPKGLWMNHFIFSGKGTIHVEKGNVKTYTEGANLFVYSNQGAGSAFVPGSTVTASNGLFHCCGGINPA